MEPTTKITKTVIGDYTFITTSAVLDDKWSTETEVYDKDDNFLFKHVGSRPTGR